MRRHSPQQEDRSPHQGSKQHPAALECHHSTQQLTSHRAPVLLQEHYTRLNSPEVAKSENSARDSTVELGRTAEEQSSVHFQQIQYLEK